MTHDQLLLLFCGLLSIFDICYLFTDISSIILCPIYVIQTWYPTCFISYICFLSYILYPTTFAHNFHHMCIFGKSYSFGKLGWRDIRLIFTCWNVYKIYKSQNGSEAPSLKPAVAVFLWRIITYIPAAVQRRWNLQSASKYA